MIIKELNLIGFGKFENKIINLKDGLNLIYGENEFGKTTIHNFIDGMFYGFLKPYAKTTIYLDEHAKYNPWTNTNYKGTLKFEYKGQLYSIERNFAKGQETTKVILDSTGEDITYSIDTGNSGRMLQPGFHFFGFNNAVYSNTVSIQQLGIKTEDSLANEVRDKLVNVTRTLDENISIEQSINELDKALKSIGTIKAYTSSYGIEYEKLISLKEERDEILSFKNEYEELLEEETLIDIEIDKYKSKIEELESRIKGAKIIAKRQLYLEGKQIKENIETLTNKANDYKIYDSLSMEDYSTCIAINNDINHLDKIISHTSKIISNLDKEIESLRRLETEKVNMDESIIEDYHYYEELENNNTILANNMDSNKLEFIKRDYKSNKSLKNSLNILLIVSVLIFIAISIYSAINSKYGYLIFNIFILIIVAFVIYKNRRLNGLLKRIEFQKNELESLAEINRLKIIENEEIMKDILNKYKVTNKLQVKRLQDNIQLEIYKKNKAEDELNEIVEKSIILQEELDIARMDSYNYKVELKDLLEKNVSGSIEEFKRGLENKDKYEDILVEIENKKDLYSRILGNSKLEEILKQLEEFEDYLNIQETLTKEELEESMSDLREELNSKNISKSALKSKLEFFATRISDLVNIEEEINRATSNLLVLDHKRAALEVARNTIEDLSKDIHRQFAPAINKRVGKVIEQITDGKYKAVRIDDKLEMSVINPISKENININSLSGGTIDQLYFALRFEIINSMSGSRLPLILDDCFIQYDDIRLENILRFIKDKSKERQIILFTCQKREMELLNKIDANYNLVAL